MCKAKAHMQCLGLELLQFEQFSLSHYLCSNLKTITCRTWSIFTKIIRNPVVIQLFDISYLETLDTVQYKIINVSSCTYQEEIKV